jgi:uncharacterized protein (DUF1501 family)
MAIVQEQLLPVADGSLGFHPGLPGLRDIYNEGKLAVANNIGNFFEPISREAYFDFLDGNNPGLNVPPDLFAL